jgi:hypothetical protein
MVGLRWAAIAKLISVRFDQRVVGREAVEPALELLDWCDETDGGLVEDGVVACGSGSSFRSCVCVCCCPLGSLI